MDCSKIAGHIQSWLVDYINSSPCSGFVVGVSGGIDSAVVSKLCALTSRKTTALILPISNNQQGLSLARQHVDELSEQFPNFTSLTISLGYVYDTFREAVPLEVRQNPLVMANSQSRLRMTALYAVAQANNCLVVGTGNKVEDFGIGFFTKHGDGGVDISPIGDLMKTEVFALGKFLGISQNILNASPTDGLFDDQRTDEQQIGATYAELEWAMTYIENDEDLTKRQSEVLQIYKKLNQANQHKMNAIPKCEIPREYFYE